jgi:hypothetical protein
MSSLTNTVFEDPYARLRGQEVHRRRRHGNLDSGHSGVARSRRTLAGLADPPAARLPRRFAPETSFGIRSAVVPGVLAGCLVKNFVNFAVDFFDWQASHGAVVAEIHSVFHQTQGEGGGKHALRFRLAWWIFLSPGPRRQVIFFHHPLPASWWIFFSPPPGVGEFFFTGPCPPAEGPRHGPATGGPSLPAPVLADSAVRIPSPFPHTPPLSPCPLLPPSASWHPALPPATPPSLRHSCDTSAPDPLTRVSPEGQQRPSGHGTAVAHLRCPDTCPPTPPCPKRPAPRPPMTHSPLTPWSPPTRKNGQRSGSACGERLLAENSFEKIVAFCDRGCPR